MIFGGDSSLHSYDPRIVHFEVDTHVSRALSDYPMPVVIMECLLVPSSSSVALFFWIPSCC